jgi:hypothetical protein
VKTILCFSLALCGLLRAQTPAPGTVWKFAASGDSRNCGDIVMPAIAAGVRQDGAEFYWHLGDFRAIYKFDEDMVPPPGLGLTAQPTTVSTYLLSAWPDFIAHQLNPFDNTPIFLAIGNHETILPATREAWLLQFADWLNTPALRAQRLKDNPQDHKLHTYYHWVDRGVDFITVDNASSDQFDAAQLAWLRAVLHRDEDSAEIRSIVIGMHAALPDSVAHVHSMNDWAQGEKSGREVYEMLWHAHASAHKNVYVLASHSHFFMENIFETTAWRGKVLPGWIVGTAGAVRYRLPAEVGLAQHAQTDVYGFLLGTVDSDGAISFAFQKLTLEDLIHADQGKHPLPMVRWCFEENKQLQPLR